MTDVQATARAIFAEWAKANGQPDDFPDVILGALRREYFTEAADEVGAIPLPAALLAYGGPKAEATRKVLNDASKKLKQIAEKAAVKCPPGTHGMFHPLPRYMQAAGGVERVKLRRFLRQVHSAIRRDWMRTLPVQARDDLVEYIVAYCPDHGTAPTSRMNCHCEIADEISRM